MFNGIFQFISQSITTIAANIIVFIFFIKKYDFKYTRKLVYICVFIFWSFVMIVINSFNNPLFNMIYTFISSELICIYFFKTNVKNSILFNTLLILIGIFCEASTFFIWSALWGKRTNEIYMDEQLTFISNLLYILMFYIAYRIFSLITIKSDVNGLRIKETIFLLIITVFENLIVYNYTLKMTTKTDGIMVIAMLIGFLFFNIYITFLIKSVSDVYQYKYEISLLTKQSELQLENYKDLDLKYNQSRRIIHDMKKHLIVYRDLEENKAEDYRKTLENEIDEIFRGFQCTNTILSIITSQKYSQSEKNHINVNVRMEDLPLDFISDLDITAIFANLWDNAIEASEGLDEKSRHIDFIMRKVNEFVIINMENTCVDSMSIYDTKGKVVSSKKNHMGLGLSIVEETVKKYNGFFHIRRDNRDKFIVELTIPTIQ